MKRNLTIGFPFVGRALKVPEPSMRMSVGHMPGNWHVRFLGGVSYPVLQLKENEKVQ